MLEREAGSGGHGCQMATCGQAVSAQGSCPALGEECLPHFFSPTKSQLRQKPWSKPRCQGLLTSLSLAVPFCGIVISQTASPYSVPALCWVQVVSKARMWPLTTVPWRRQISYRILRAPRRKLRPWDMERERCCFLGWGGVSHGMGPEGQERVPQKKHGGQTLMLSHTPMLWCQQFPRPECPSFLWA